MENEVEQLKVLVGDLFSRIESLEERVEFLEDCRDSAQPKGPEPILTCVQCLAEYKESENAEGYCKYHTGIVIYGFKTKVKCCEVTAQSVEQLIPYSGCTKGKHRSKHHTEFLYTNYLLFMRELSKSAEEMWVEMDVYDYIAKICPWAEVGKSKENELFVVAGFASHRPEVCASLKPQQLTKCKKSSVLFEKSDDTGLSFLKAELVTSGLLAEAIIVTIKTSWSKIPYAKKISFSCKQNDVKFGSIECLSDPRPEKPSQNYSIPEENRTGPVLEPGEDYSQGRRNDYPTVTNDDLFAMEMKQLKKTEVDSITWGMNDDKWINCFIVDIKVTNGSLDVVSIQDVLGEYQNEAGEWVKCKKALVRPTEEKKFLEVNDFLVDGSAPMTIVVQLDIEIEGRSPNGNQECQRAHHSLPQPLFLRVTLIDSQNRTASLIFEQGNTPLPLATMESRQARWSKKKPLLFHLLADDVDLRKRSDVAIYYNEDLTYVYRPAPNSEGGTSFYIRDSMLETLAYNAKKTGTKEQELTELAKENKGSKIQVFGIVDLENQFTFALKVMITTPTSSATGYCLLPRKEEIYQATLTVPPEVEVGSTLTVEWSISQASKNDRLEIHKRLNNNQISMECNRKEETKGSIKMKIPKSPGEYEVRYYPSCLRSSNTSLGHSICVASAVFTVVPA